MSRWKYAIDAICDTTKILNCSNVPPTMNDISTMNWKDTFFFDYWKINCFNGDDIPNNSLSSGNDSTIVWIELNIELNLNTEIV